MHCPGTANTGVSRRARHERSLILAACFQWTAAGQPGLCGLGVRPNATPASTRGSGSAVPPPRSMRAAAASAHTYRPETATRILAQVLHRLFLHVRCLCVLFRIFRDRNRPSSFALPGACPGGMVYMTAAECEAQGGACPRACLDVTSTEVQCATTCYDGCYCAPGFYLLNGSCAPLARCPCYHRGELYRAGASFPVDTCNNWCDRPHLTASRNLRTKKMTGFCFLKQHVRRRRNGVRDGPLPR